MSIIPDNTDIYLYIYIYIYMSNNTCDLSKCNNTKAIIQRQSYKDNHTKTKVCDNRFSIAIVIVILIVIVVIVVIVIVIVIW